MSKHLKIPSFSREKAGSYILILSIIALLSLFALKDYRVKADVETPLEPSSLLISQSNCLLPLSNPLLLKGKTKATDRVQAVITAYSSTPWETDSTPTITAAGTKTRDGVIANNLLPFGTKVRIPELYGDKIFVVEDHMSWRRGDQQFDIWLPSHSEAKSFGVKRTYIEILEI